MAFLDNSGDIILDAVLTDTGRFRLAKGDGSFKITRFALGDDEINYANYDKNHASGSAYYDLRILQTPILEAFTNNTSTMKSKLITIPKTNLKYLPVMVMNRLEPVSRAFALNGVTTGEPARSYFVSCDKKTNEKYATLEGCINGVSPNANSQIWIDQGLQTVELSPSISLDQDLIETQWILQLDSRLGQIATPVGGGATPWTFVDDDKIAHYYLSPASDPDYFTAIAPQDTEVNVKNSPLEGPRGNRLMFTIQASLELQTSTYLFNTIGGIQGVADATADATVNSCRFIDTNVRVIGGTTGYSIDVPIRFFKLA